MHIKTSNTRYFRGLTLVELLVVMAITSLLLALITPAIYRSWATGQLASCRNNAYQLAFALQRYDDMTGGLPGWLNPSPFNAVNASGTGRCSWPILLLPYIGRADLADSWPQLPKLDAEPTIQMLLCPSNPPNRSTTKYACAQYAGNIGCDGARLADGVFLNLSSTSTRRGSIDDIADADGVAMTLAFAEKSALLLPPTNWALKIPSGTSVPSPIFGSGSTALPIFGVPNVSTTLPCGSVNLPSKIVNDFQTRDYAPSSAHGKGAVVAFCDGHTGFLSNDIQPFVYGQILTPKSRWKVLQNGNRTNQTNTSPDPSLKLQYPLEPWVVLNPQADNPRLCPSTTNPWLPYLLDETILKQ